MTLDSLLLHHFLSLLFLCFAFVSSADEMRSLLEFKKGIKEDPLGRVFNSWSRASSSDPSSCPDSFYGVLCDDYGFVSAISLDRLGLAGELKFFTLNGLKMLKNLSLSGNSFTGRLVPALGLISSLQHLDLSGNQFYGPIPARIHELWGLNYLNLSNNNLTGGFPRGIQNLQQLKALDLHSNMLWGDVQDLFSELRNVEFVDLSYNVFYGSLSMEVENISSLANTVQFLNLSHNKLGGGFFNGDSIKLFRNLQVLDLGDNGVFGELPSFDSLPKLRVLRLGNNQLFGSIPEELLASSIPLEELDLNSNGFSGSVRGIESTTLSTLNLSSNMLSGSLPRSIGSCQTVDLSRNMLSDDMSVIKSWPSTFKVLDLSSNQLTGTIPNLTSQFQSLTTLKISNNSLIGPLPTDLGTYTKLSTVDFSSNQLEGPIPRSMFTSVSLTSLNLSGNHFSGLIPLPGSHTSELLVLPPYLQLESLDLSDNSLAGGLPSEIGNLGRLKLLNLAKNRLSGDLPDELSKLNGLEYLDLSSNNFSGHIPKSLRNFPITSFRPGNELLFLPNGRPSRQGDSVEIRDRGKRHSSKSSVRVAIIVASVGSAFMIAFVLLAYHRSQMHKFRLRSGFGGQTTTGREVKTGIFKFQTNVEPPPTSVSFSNDHLLTSNSRPLEFENEIIEHVSVSLPVTSSPVTLDVHSPNRLAGKLFFFDSSLTFTPAELSRAPAEVLGRSSHGTLYKASLDSGYVLTVKWLRVGLVKNEKEFAKEVKKIGSIRHPNIVPLRAYYWGPKEQERLLLADYVQGDSLAIHLYETTPRRYSLLTFDRRLKVAVDVARCLMFLHDKGLSHGNLKPTNIILAGPELNASITDYGLHHLMTPSGIAEQILNHGALGYRAPELQTVVKPIPSAKADVYSFGVILMELLTRRSAGDIISGQSGAVDLTDWVQMCDQEGRRMDSVDRDMVGPEEQMKAVDELLVVSLRCILPVNERPKIRQVFQHLCSISV